MVFCCRCFNCVAPLFLNIEKYVLKERFADQKNHANGDCSFHHGFDRDNGFAA